MGFSAASTFGSLGFYPRSHHKSPIFLGFGQWEGHPVNFKLSKFKPRPWRISSCKPEIFEFEERTSPNEVKKEIERCYELIHRLGRGVVYLGSSRMGQSHPHYLRALELGREIANLLHCTSWTGAGPGLMDAATKGALQAGKPVGGFKIGKEAGEWKATNFHPYLPSETYFTCRFFSARKHGLVDAAVRRKRSDRTAVVALPGGIGTLDEVIARHGGVVAKEEVSSLWKVCDNNLEALGYLQGFYDLPTGKSREGDRSESLHSTVF